MDSMFTGGESVTEKTAVLAVTEQSSQMLAATVVPRKSTGQCAAKRVVVFMRETGCDQVGINVKCENEPAIVDWHDASRAPKLAMVGGTFGNPP